MDLILAAFARSWPFEPWLAVSLLLSAGLYLRGWLILRRRNAGQWQLRHLVYFLSGLAAIFLALASPIEPFAVLLLQVHMAQHLLLTMVAPPLLWLGWPLVPMLRGLPAELRTYWVVPLLRSPDYSLLLSRTYTSLSGTAPLCRIDMALARASIL